MKELFMMGLICLLNPVNEQPYCLNFFEDPKNYYVLEDCKLAATEKVNKIKDNFTERGFIIIRLQIACVVDNNKLNT